MTRKTNTNDCDHLSNAVEPKSSKILVTTSIGEFTIITANNAPITSSYFIDLAVKGDLNNGKIFRITTLTNQNIDSFKKNEGINPSHPIEVIQVGTQSDLNEPLHKIDHESTNETQLRHKRWTVSAARFAPGEVYKSFFICMRDEPCLDAGGGRNPDGEGFAAFGHIINGFDVVENIFNKSENNEILKKPIHIHSFKEMH